MPFKQTSSNLAIKTLKVDQSIIKVELADTPAKQRQGLSGRDNLALDSGMLFVYNQPTQNYFWMRDMKFALDFIWIRQGQVIQLDQNIPPPANLTDQPVKIYCQNYYDMVLEVPAGWVASQQIKVGDQVELLP